jgi:RNA polymerase sigma-70 factor (ECF subfamily)
MCDEGVVGVRYLDRDDRELLVLARDSPDAFAVFYRRHVDGVLAYYRRRGADADQALDLTAETFAAALESIERYAPGREPGVAWLFGIAGHVLADSHRRGVIADRARRKIALARLVVDDEALLRVEERIAHGRRVDLQSLVERLPEHERRAVLARVVDELGYEQIAGDLRCSAQLVRKRVSRGLGRLRAALSEERS